ncbi:MAG TPA: delta-60 repeat domain-containing protein [Solirubrobacterales bacterium]|nr:delta-60 repeat domain-containing protein [Solirubrobacterales bacterium]
MAGIHARQTVRARTVLVALLAVGMLCGVAPAASLADGEIDTSFSGDGRVIVDFEGGEDEALAATVDAKGRLVLAGYSFKSPDGIRLAVARYLSDGSLDPSFDGDGLLLDNHGGGIVARDVAIDTAGRIVVAGPNARDEHKAIRLLEDGRIDTSFGRGGVVHVQLDLFDIRALVIDRLGRILLAGSNQVNFNDLDFGAIRIRDDGSLDPSFDGDGLVTFDTAGGANADRATDVFLDAFNRIVLAGSAWLPAPGKSRKLGRFALLRLHDNGQVDSSLRESGTALIAMNKRGSFATAAALVGSGSMIVTGRAAPRTGFAKVWGSGALPKGFGNGGRAKLATGGAQWAMDLAIDGAGRPVAAIGAPKLSADGAGALIAARLRPHGRPDRSFSNDSRALVRFGRWRATATSLALDANGGIVVAGVGRRSDANHSDFVAARFRGGQ